MSYTKRHIEELQAAGLDPLEQDQNYELYLSEQEQQEEPTIPAGEM